MNQTADQPSFTNEESLIKAREARYAALLKIYRPLAIAFTYAILTAVVCLSNILIPKPQVWITPLVLGAGLIVAVAVLPKFLGARRIQGPQYGNMAPTAVATLAMSTSVLFRGPESGIVFPISFSVIMGIVVFFVTRYSYDKWLKRQAMP